MREDYGYDFPFNGILQDCNDNCTSDCEHHQGDCIVCGETLCSELTGDAKDFRTVDYDGELDAHFRCKEDDLKKRHKQHSLDLLQKLWWGTLDRGVYRCCGA